MAGESPPPLPPLAPTAQSAAPPSLRSPSPTTASLTMSHEQICEEHPAAGEVVGDPQPHASGVVGGEPKMPGEIHGELPKKICKKLDAEQQRGVRGAVHQPGGVPDAGGEEAEQRRRRLPCQHPVAEELLAAGFIIHHTNTSLLPP